MKDEFQFLIYSWAKLNFGSVASKREERLLRVLEEALELVQAGGIDKEKVLQFADVVYAEPKGLVKEELSDLQLNLYALAEHYYEPLDLLSKQKFARCLERDREYWQGRQERKYLNGMSTRCE